VKSPPVVEWGGKVRVIEYAHVEDILQDFPMNAFPPDPTFEYDVNKGFLMPSVRATTPVEQANLRFDTNWFRFFHCPGSVTGHEKGWRWECHTRSIGSDMVFAEREIPVYLYLSPEGTSEPARIGAAPAVKMFARMMSGIREGTLLAQSEPSTEGVSIVSRPGQPDVFELRTLMLLHQSVFEKSTIATEMGYRVEVGVYQHNQNAVEFQQRFRVRTGPQFPARIILPLLDPLSFHDDLVRTENGTLHYFMRVESDLGAYDVNTTAAQAHLRVRGEDFDSALTLVDVIGEGSREHDAVGNPVIFHYAVEVKQIQAQGPLTFDFSVPNQQGTYVLHHSKELPFANFSGAKSLPSLAMTGILAMLVGLSILRRRLEKP
jgi:hypothetical protein